MHIVCKKDVEGWKLSAYLYIQTPPSQARQIEDESTSVYVNKTAKCHSLIMHQLRFFSRPINKDRQLYFQLKNGEHLTGVIEKVNGEEVLVSAFEQKIWLAAESIAYITTK